MKKLPTGVMLFIKETVERLSKKSPTFFKRWNLFNGIIALLAGIPTIIDIFGDVIPEKWVAISLKIAAFCGTWGYLMGKQTVDRQREDVKLPFSKSMGEGDQVIIDSWAEGPDYKWIQSVPGLHGNPFLLCSSVSSAYRYDPNDVAAAVAYLNGLSGNTDRFYSGNPTSTPPPKPF